MTKLVDQMFARFARTRDLTALAFVFEHSEGALRRRARRLVVDAKAAEDLVQDLFLSMIVGQVNYDPERPCRPYLIGALHRRAATMHRSEARRSEAEVRMAVVKGTSSIDPEQQARDREIDDAVRAAVSTLPAISREVVRRYLHLRQTPQEIAAELGRAAGTVRVQLHRGLRALRDALPPGFLAVTLMALLRPRPVVAATALSPVRRFARVGIVVVAALCVITVALRIQATRAMAETESATTLAVAVDPALANESTDAPIVPPVVRSDVNPRYRRVVLRHADGSPAAFVGGRVGVPGTDIDLHWQQFVSDAAGTVMLERDAAMRELQTDRGTHTSLVVAASSTGDDLTIALPAGVDVEGLVVDQHGRPVAGAGIWVSHRPRHPWSGQVTTHADAEGHFILRGMHAMSTFAAIGVGCVPSPVQVPQTTETVVLRLGGPTAVVAGYVRGNDGAPIEGAVVHVSRHGRGRMVPTAGEQFVSMVPAGAARSDASGRFECVALPAGRLVVSVRAPDYECASIAVRADAGQRRVVDLHMRRGRDVRGVVRDLAGCAVAGAMVVTHGRSLQQWSGVTTGSGGHFLLSGIGRERILLAVEAVGYRRHEVALPANRGESLVIELEPLSIVRGRFVWGDGCSATATNPELGWRLRGAAGSPTAVTLALDGSFEISLAHEVDFYCRASGGLWLPCVRQREDNGDLRLAASVVPHAELAVRLHGYTPAELADARVLLWRGTDAYEVDRMGGLDAAVVRAQVPCGDYAVAILPAAGRCPPCAVGSVTLGEHGQVVDVMRPLSGGFRYRSLLAGGVVERWQAFVIDEAGLRIPLLQPCGRLVLPVGRYKLWASGLSFLAVRGREFEVRAEVETLLELELRPGTVRQIAFRLPSEFDVSQAEITVCSLADGKLVFGGDRAAARRAATIGVDGSGWFAVTLADGAYELTVRVGNQAVAGAFAVAGEGGTFEPIFTDLGFLH